MQFVLAPWATDCRPSGPGSTSPESLGPGPRAVAPARDAPAGRSPLKEYRDHAERDFIIATLRRNNGNVSQAAIELGVGRTYLHRRLSVLNVTKRDFLV